MKKFLKSMIFTMMFAASIGSITSMAAEKIKSVSVKFHIQEYDEEGTPYITATTTSQAYTCGEVDVYYSDEDYREKAVSEETYVVDLYAADENAFYLTKASQVKLSGAGAQYVKASRLENGTLLRLLVKFTELKDVCGTTENVKWDSDGKVTWDAAYNATKYKVVLRRDSHRKVVYTGGTSYDFRPLLTKEGSYEVRVTPISKSGYQAETEESNSFRVSKEMATYYEETYGVEKEIKSKDPSGEISGPGSVEIIYKNIGWKQDANGWWWQNEDGSYPQYDWMKYGEDWYFFDSTGYMVTDQVIKWGPDEFYIDINGLLVTNKQVPDGRKADANGILTGKKTNEAESGNTEHIGPGSVKKSN